MIVTIVVGIVMILGLIGTVVPGIPGLFFVWGAALAYGISEGFNTVGAVTFSIITALSIVGAIATYVVPPKRASDAGARFSSIALGTGLAVVLMFVIPVVGLFIGGVLGIYGGERLRGADHSTAYSATVATLVGFGIGVAIELGTALAAILIWLIWVIANNT